MTGCDGVERVPITNDGETPMIRTLIIAAALSLVLWAPVSAQDSTAGVMIVQHKVADYEAWRPVYDADAAKRAAAGLTNARVYRSADDPNDIVIIADMADLAKAKAFATSETLKESMEKAGVQGEPTITYLNAAP